MRKGISGKAKSQSRQMANIHTSQQQDRLDGTLQVDEYLTALRDASCIQNEAMHGAQSAAHLLTVEAKLSSRI